MSNNSNSWWKWRDEILAKTKKEDMPEMINFLSEYYALIKVCALMSSSTSPAIIKLREDKLQRKHEVVSWIEEKTKGI